jgi:hypothetical protein
MKPEDIRLIDLSYVRPPLQENKAKDWVLNGVKNSFYQYIIDRFNGSVTNSAIISSYIDLMYGKGLSAKDANIKVTQWVQLLQLIKNSELKKIISDFVLFGEASIQVVKQKGDKKLISGIYHLPKQYVVPKIENEKGEIEGYFYSKDFSKTQIEPIFFPAFGTSSEAIEVYRIAPYKAGKNYFSDPDYLAAIPYALLEEEIANFYVSSIKNGLSAGYVINIPDGQTLTTEEKDRLEAKIKDKITGSPNAMKFVISFNSKDAEITIVPFPVNENVHKQWEFLSGESRQQIMTAHKVVSPKLFGIISDGGLGNNANELDEAEAQLMKRVIGPKQIHIIDALKEIVLANGIILDLYFKPLTDKVVAPVQMSKHEINNALIALGEDAPIDYELIDEIEVDYEEEDKLELSVSTGSAFPNAKSSQDGKDFIVRYKYSGNKLPERQFCKQMMSANKIYRKEDIVAMENIAVNSGWGADGAQTYSIWLYKGGGNCHHKWVRQIYLKKGVKVDTNSPLAEIISTSEAMRRGYKLKTNDTLVSVEPRNMDNNGFLKVK